MPTSTRFTAAIHILTILAIKSEAFVSSEFIAKSVGTNAVVVRRILAALADAGIVVTHSGIQGGAKLNIDPGKLSLLRIYSAVENRPLLRAHDPQTDCAVAKSVKTSVDEVLEDVQAKLKEELDGLTLSQIVDPAKQAFEAMYKR